MDLRAIWDINLVLPGDSQSPACSCMIVVDRPNTDRSMENVVRCLYCERPLPFYAKIIGKQLL